MALSLGFTSFFPENLTRSPFRQHNLSTQARRNGEDNDRRRATMCLILLAWQTHPEFPLVVAANRDEFYARPSAGAGRWPADPRILGGRDLEAGGTWLGLREDGRFAGMTDWAGKLPGAAAI